MSLTSFRSVFITHSFNLYKPLASLLFFSSSTHQTRIVSTSDHLLKEHQKKTDSVLSFLNENGFSKTQLQHIAQYLPKFLRFELEYAIEPKIKIFQDMGFSPTEIAEIISSEPRILSNSYDSNNQLKRSLLALRKLLGSSLTVYVINKYSKKYLHKDFDNSILPNVEFLQSWGISSSQIIFLVSQHPSYMFIRPDTFKETAKKVEEMGVYRESKMFIYALRALKSMTVENWEHKLDVFRSIGLSECDIVSTFRRVPFVFCISEKKIREVTELLFGSGLYDVSFIVDQPQVLIYSIERIKPRLQVLKVLKRHNLLTLKGSTYTFYMSEKKFIANFVLPFLDRAPELLEMISEGNHQLKIVGEPSQV